MNFKKKFLTAITSGFAVIALGSFAMAQETPKTAPTEKRVKGERKNGERGFGKREFGRRGGKFGMQGLQKLNLTEAQKEQVRALRESVRNNKENKPNREEMRQIMEAKRNGTITAEQEAKIKAMREAKRAEMQRLHEQMLAILTPEQKLQLEQMKKERQTRREGFRQNRQDKLKTDQPKKN